MYQQISVILRLGHSACKSMLFYLYFSTKPVGLVGQTHVHIKRRSHYRGNDEQPNPTCYCQYMLKQYVPLYNSYSSDTMVSKKHSRTIKVYLHWLGIQPKDELVLIAENNFTQLYIYGKSSAICYWFFLFT